MIKNYIKPQTFIKQVLDILPDNPAERINAYIFGPAYHLQRYTNEAERSEMEGVSFSEGSDFYVAYENRPANSVIDKDFVKLYGEKLEGLLAEFNGTDESGDADVTETFTVKSNSELNKIQYGISNLDLSILPDAEINSSLLAINYELMSFQDYLLAYNELAGSSAIPSYSPAPALNGRPLRVGDKVYITNTGTNSVIERTIVGFERNSSGYVGTVILNASAVNPVLEDWNVSNKLHVKFVKVFNGEIPKTRSNNSINWVAGDNSIQVNDGLMLEEKLVTSGYVPVVEAKDSKLFASYRAFLPYSIDIDRVLVKNNEEVTAYAGKIDPDNTLAFAGYCALRGSLGKPVYLERTRNISRAAFSEVLKKAEWDDTLYALTPLTYDINILQDVQSHIEKMSSDEVKNWRRGYFGIKNPGKYLLKAGVSGTYIVDSSQEFTRIQITTPDVNLEELNIVSGYLVKLQISGVTHEVNILSIPATDEIIVEKFGTAQSGALTDIEFWAPDTGIAQARYVATIAKSFSSRRINCIWSDSPRINFGGAFVGLEQIFLASYIAGLRSALPLQMGLTRTEVEIVSSAPTMYRKYTNDDLNYAAANGVFIITQDYPNSSVYVRHQLTTETDKGSLYYEDSVGVNNDEISYRFKDLLDEYIGKRNATPATAQEIFNRQDTLLSMLTVADPTLPIGPRILGYFDLKVSIDKLRKDTFHCEVTIAYPLSLNYIYQTIRGTVTSEETTITTE